MKPIRFEVFAVDLPFRTPFKHAAAARETSNSIFVKCTLENGASGWGESLPRVYVTGETQSGAFALLRDFILPRLLNRPFDSLGDAMEFLRECDGQAPRDWLDLSIPQTAAWCAVDGALLDACARAGSTPVRLNGDNCLPDNLRYSAVLTSAGGEELERALKQIKTFDFGQVKMKVERDGSLRAAQRAREVLGEDCDLRADANMAWTNVAEAAAAMRALAQQKITSFEQPLGAEDFAGAAQLVEETQLDVMADESLNTRQSLENLIARRAATAVNIRLSKCGGLVASLSRCREARAANLKIQIGCQVGETSLLSAAQLILLRAAQGVEYVEGAFSTLLLKDDPALPNLQFGRGGLAPVLPDAPGLGVEMDEEMLRAHATQSAVVS